MGTSDRRTCTIATSVAAAATTGEKEEMKRKHIDSLYCQKTDRFPQNCSHGITPSTELLLLLSPTLLRICRPSREAPFILEEEEEGGQKKSGIPSSSSSSHARWGEEETTNLPVKEKERDAARSRTLEEKRKIPKEREERERERIFPESSREIVST